MGEVVGVLTTFLPVICMIRPMSMKGIFVSIIKIYDQFGKKKIIARGVK
jgi:hypothetical protein